MAVRLYLILDIDNPGAGLPNINGDIIPALTVDRAIERGIIEEGRAIIDSGFLTIDPEDDSFYTFKLDHAEDI
jgi:hypothetical protein